MKLRVVVSPRSGSTVQNLLSSVLIAAGIVCMGVFVWSELDSWVYQYVQLEYSAAGKLPLPAQPGVPLTPPVAASPPQWLERDPQALGILEIPRLDMRIVVREGIDAATLRRSVGHVPATALPGEAGNAVLAGHRDRHFRSLRKIRRGDRILFEGRDGRYEYIVDSTMVVDPDAVSLMRPTADARLTLITCFPFYYAGPAPRRFAVRAYRAQ
ncbi:MAG: class D sortase [Bryobacterales bacterium]|nr:class D sortase [Bryobacterales bacterium]